MLTDRMRECLLFIADYQKKSGGVSPSFTEIRDAVGRNSQRNVQDWLGALEERGFIKRLPNRARAIQIVKPIPGAKPLRGRAKRIPIFDAKTHAIRGYLP